MPSLKPVKNLALCGDAYRVFLMYYSCLCSRSISDVVAGVWVVQQRLLDSASCCEVSSFGLATSRRITSAVKAKNRALLVHRQERWLELDAYYTGANRSKDPSDLGPRPPKPDEPLILPNDSAADLTSPPSSRLAVAKTGIVDDAVTRQALLFPADGKFDMSKESCP